MTSLVMQLLTVEQVEQAALTLVEQILLTSLEISLEIYLAADEAEEMTVQ